MELLYVYVGSEFNNWKWDEMSCQALRRRLSDESSNQIPAW